MTSYTFHPRFSFVVKTGQKRSTIRRRRKVQPAVRGEPLDMYAAATTSEPVHLGQWPCTAVHPIEIHPSHIVKNRARLSDSEALQLAKDDGFRTVSEFIKFFERVYGLPFLDAEQIEW